MMRRGRVAAVPLAIVLVVSLTLHHTEGQASRVGRSARIDASSVQSASHDVGWDMVGSSTAASSALQLSSRADANPPPDGTLRVASRYVENYGARRASWQDLIDHGRPLPAVSARCAERWRTSGKDPRLNWTSVGFLCLDALTRSRYKPQGIGGSATTQHYFIGSQPASDRNIILTSWYSRAPVPGLFAPNRPNESVTRLVVLDMDKGRYNTVELVKPDGSDGFRNLNSHGSGLAWAGQYIYSSSHSQLWMYNADDLLEISGHFVLPAVARWAVHGRGGLSSISLDRSTTPNQLKSIHYSKKRQTYLHSFNLAWDGLLEAQSAETMNDLSIENQFGEPGRVVHSTSSMVIRGTNYQGVGSAGPYTFANSSGLRTRLSPHRKVDATAVMRDGRVIESIQMPSGNGESVYIDYKRGTYQSIVEQGSQFIFAIPLRQLIETAERP